MDLPIFCGEPIVFPKFLTKFETKLNILTAPKFYKLISRFETPAAHQTEVFEPYLEAFKVIGSKVSLGDHLQDIASSIPEKQMEKIEGFM